MTAGPTGQFWLLVSAPRSKKGYFAIFLIVEEAPYSHPLVDFNVYVISLILPSDNKLIPGYFLG